MEKSTFLELAKPGLAIPVYKNLLTDTQTPVSLFMKLRQDARYPFLFESVEGGEHLARYSFMGRNPYQVLKFDQGKVLLTDERNGRVRPFNEPYFKVLEQLTSGYIEPKISDLPRLKGGAVGYSSYDTIRQVEYLPNIPEDTLGLPDAIWAFYDEIIAFDHVKHRVILIKTVFIDADDKETLEFQYEHAQKSIQTLETVITQKLPETNAVSLTSEVSSNTEKSRFFEMVDKAKNYIFEGDIFQVVLSQRFAASYVGDRFQFYRALRTVNPSPYLFFLEFGKFALIGSSPEVLVRVQDRITEVLPIAGTRWRGKTEEEDLALEADLLGDPKEVSEHIMLVDLGRNDLSRVCEPGSVKVHRQAYIERYSHVMHIVSDVKGKLSADKTSVDALARCFPAGTVSGAPKVRAMEIIDELEVHKRGPYAGAVGYFDVSGNMDTCIALRTMVATDDAIYIQAGAGIVADSDAEYEYQETVNKAKALTEALKLAGNIV
ncbi:MAG: anthranilate synthase component I [Bacteroidetes bacterium]|nr:anthranilate synthase component I [Bacteroidota bacterium]